jgi:hypothetical protein
MRGLHGTLAAIHPEFCRQRGIDYQEQTSTRRSRPSALTSAT